MKKLLLLAVLLAPLTACISEGPGLDVTSNCGPAPVQPGTVVESNAGRVSMDAAMWHQLQVWFADTALWTSCVESL